MPLGRLAPAQRLSCGSGRPQRSPDAAPGSSQFSTSASPGKAHESQGTVLGARVFGLLANAPPPEDLSGPPLITDAMMLGNHYRGSAQRPRGKDTRETPRLSHSETARLASETQVIL